MKNKDKDAKFNNGEMKAEGSWKTENPKTKLEVEELKTQREIREQVYSQCKNEEAKRLLEHLFRLEDVEAVKWVKRLNYEHLHEADINIRWIKHFFNLKEEDLK